MKKVIVIALAIISFNTSLIAQDTTIIDNAMFYVMEKKCKTCPDSSKYVYMAQYNGLDYMSNKTSFNRYFLYTRLGVKPIVAMITNKGKKRIVVL